MRVYFWAGMGSNVTREAECVRKHILRILPIGLLHQLVGLIDDQNLEERRVHAFCLQQRANSACTNREPVNTRPQVANVKEKRARPTAKSGTLRPREKEQATRAERRRRTGCTNQACRPQCATGGSAPCLSAWLCRR